MTTTKAAHTLRQRLTRREVECLLAAAGNADPCMFDENPEASEREKEKDRAAWESGMEKLRVILAARRARSTGGA